MHERQAIREAVVSALTGETDAGDRVYKSRLPPLPVHKLPAICVYTEDESTDETTRNSAPRELKRTARVAVDVWDIATTGAIDDRLDDLALDVETAMDADLNLNETAFDSCLLSSEIGLDLKGERPMGCIHMVYAIDYHTDLRVEDLVDDFDTADIRYENLGAGEIENDEDGDDQPHDLLEDIHE